MRTKVPDNNPVVGAPATGDVGSLWGTGEGGLPERRSVLAQDFYIEAVSNE